MRSSPNAETESEQPREEDRRPSEEQPGEIMISYPPTPDSLNNVRIICFKVLALPSLLFSSNIHSLVSNHSVLHVVS